MDGGAASSAPLRDPRSVAIDGAGNIYIADGLDHRIRRVSPQGVITTAAGTGIAGYAGDRGKATAAQLDNPHSVATDAIGNVYIADYGNNVVRRISTDGTINTIAGNGTPKYGGDGPALKTGFSPQSIAVDSKGTTLYIADDYGFRILKMDIVSGKITAIAGNGTMADFISGETGPGLSCRVGMVAQMTVDSAGNLYLADVTDARVRKIDSNGNLSTVAGSGPYGYISDGAPAIQAVMLPLGIAFDSSGNMLIADLNRDLIFKVGPDGLIHTLAGTGANGFSGDNGPPIRAALNAPRSLAFSPVDGTVYFSDYGNSRVRKISSQITTVAGTDARDGGPATAAFLNVPWGVAVDGSGHVAFADTLNLAVREFAPGGIINSAGQLDGGIPAAVATDQAGNFYVTDDEPAVLKIATNGSTAEVSKTTNDDGALTGVAVDAAGNVYVTDYFNMKVRKITGSGVSIVAGNGNIRASGDNGPAIAAGIDPFDIAVDSSQNLYLADRANHRIRKVSSDGTIHTIAGTGVPGYSGDGGPATSAMLTDPTGIAVDKAGNLYICDRGNEVIRRVTPGGLITTIGGSGQAVPATGDGGLAIEAQLDPWRVAVDSAGNLYVSDLLNDRVRKLTPKAVTPVTIKITAGNNQTGSAGVTLKTPLSVQVVDAAGAGVPGVIVDFSVIPTNAATVSPMTAITLNDGTATTTVSLGSASGTATITASVAGINDKATFKLTITSPPSSSAPQISRDGVVSAGLSVPAVRALAPNAIASVFGVNFAAAGTVRQVGGDDLVNGKLPTQLAGVCVQIGTQYAPIFAVYPTQINFQVPALPLANATVQVITGCNGAAAQTSNSAPVTIQATAPEFFYLVNSGGGHNPIAATNGVTGTYIGVPGLLTGGSFSPAKPGDIVTMFATGLGATDPSFAPGELPGSAGTVVAPVSMAIGGVSLSDGDILYAGVVGGNAGLYQLNVRVPNGVGDGDQTVILTVGGVASPANGYITIAH